MPAYDVMCPEGHREEIVRSIKDSTPFVCSVCGKESKVSFENMDELQVIYRGNWPGKIIREKDYRAKRSRMLDKKQREVYGNSGGVSLVPNVGGQQCESWAEAREVAKKSGKNAASYDRLVTKEKSKKGRKKKVS